jgi:ADP-heptose:LPS heptosyltransferase
MKILIIRFSSLGDVVLTTGPIKLLKNYYPDIKIDLLTYSSYKAIFINNPDIDNILVIDREQFFWEYIRLLRNILRNYQYVIDLQGNIKSIISSFFKRKNYALYKKYTLERRLFAKYRFFQSKLNNHITERYLNGIKKFFYLSFETLEELRPLIYGQKVDEDERTVVIHPFASKKTKEWPYFVQLTEYLVSNGLNVVIIGNGYFPEIKNATNLTNKTDISRMISEISKAKVLITTDSGPMHIGIALKKRVISIFGPTTKEFGFYPFFENCLIIEKKGLICRPCHIHGKNRCPEKHFKCMKDISVNNVFAATMNLFNTKNP